MTPGEFRGWRKSLGFKQKEAAELLGLKKRVIQYYEKGKRDGKPVDIPRSVELACYAISAGVGRFDGHATTPVSLLELDGAPGVEDSPNDEPGED